MLLLMTLGNLGYFTSAAATCSKRSLAIKFLRSRGAVGLFQRPHARPASDLRAEKAYRKATDERG